MGISQLTRSSVAGDKASYCRGEWKTWQTPTHTARLRHPVGTWEIISFTHPPPQQTAGNTGRRGCGSAVCRHRFRKNKSAQRRRSCSMWQGRWETERVLSQGTRGNESTQADGCCFSRPHFSDPRMNCSRWRSHFDPHSGKCHGWVLFSFFGIYVLFLGQL